MATSVGLTRTTAGVSPSHESAARRAPATTSMAAAAVPEAVKTREVARTVRVISSAPRSSEAPRSRSRRSGTARDRPARCPPERSRRSRPAPRLALAVRGSDPQAQTAAGSSQSRTARCPEGLKPASCPGARDGLRAVFDGRSATSGRDAGLRDHDDRAAGVLEDGGRGRGHHQAVPGAVVVSADDDEGPRTGAVTGVLGD